MKFICISVWLTLSYLFDSIEFIRFLFFQAEDGIRYLLVTGVQTCALPIAGTPKAAVGLHRNLVANTTQFRAWLVGLHDGQETVLAAMPLYHVYGMVIAMSVGMGLGAGLVLIQNPRNIEEILTVIQKYRPTLFPGVPNMYQVINQHPDVAAGSYDLSSIKACISGSAPD